MAKPSEPKKPAAKAAPAKVAPEKVAPAKATAKSPPAKDKSGETPVSSKETPAAAKTKAGAAEAAGPDHSSQAERAKALFEKLHGASAQRNAGGPPGAKGGRPAAAKAAWAAPITR